MLFCSCFEGSRFTLSPANTHASWLTDHQTINRPQTKEITHDLPNMSVLVSVCARILPHVSNKRHHKGQMNPVILSTVTASQNKMF